MAKPPYKGVNSYCLKPAPSLHCEGPKHSHGEEQPAMPVSDDERSKIMALHDQGIDNLTIAKKLNLPIRTVGSTVAWKKIRSTPGVTLSAEESESIETAIEATFGLERDLQKALRANLDQMQPGLKEGDGGKEFTTPSGRIDILAVDADQTRIVIELKAGTADRDAVGQILSYIGDLQGEGKGKVRGILIAGDFTHRAVSAANAVPNIELRKYGFKFTFSPVK